MLYAVVVLFMVVLRSASVGIALADGGHGSTMEVVGTWFVFGRSAYVSFTAGVRQVVKPGLTSEGILGIPGRQAWLLVRELGFANIATGAIGILSCGTQAGALRGAGRWPLPRRGRCLSRGQVAPGHRGERRDGLRPRDRTGDARLRRLAMVRSEVHIIW